MRCFYCLVNDELYIDAITAFDGTPVCGEHAVEQADLVQQAERDSEDAQVVLNEKLSLIRERQGRASDLG